MSDKSELLYFHCVKNVLSALLGPMEIVNNKIFVYVSELHAAFDFGVEMSRVGEMFMYI
jgi:hypothetical protein